MNYPDILIRSSALLLSFIILTLTGCTGTSSLNTCDETARAGSSEDSAGSSGNNTSISDPSETALYASCLETADSFRDIYEQASRSDALNSLETQEKIIARLGEKGCCASDADNQLNMENSEILEDFLSAAEAGEEADATVLLVMEGGSVIYYDLQTQDGSISAQRCTLYWENSEPKAGYYEAFTAEKWCYTENGYFFFDQYRMPGYDGPPGEIGIRVKPLDTDCRGYCRKYVTPIGYNRNNMLISD